MSATPMVYCRFCAEQKPPQFITYFTLSSNFRDEIVEKLSYFNFTWIDFSAEHLPETICNMCHHSLNLAYEFFNKTKLSQALLSNLISSRFKQETGDNTKNNDFEDVSTNIKDELMEVMDSELNDLLEKSDEDVPLLGFDVENQNAPSPSSEDVKADTSWSIYSWICRHCNDKFDDMDLLREHSRDSHAICNCFRCFDCETVFDNFNEFVDHVRGHRETLKFYCQYCNYRFTSPDQNIIHIKERHTKPQCEFCGEFFKDNSELQVHKTVYDPPKLKKANMKKRGRVLTVEDLTCRVCWKVTKCINNLRAHEKLHTDRRRDYFCDRCGKSFFTKSTLTAHHLIHENPEPEICKICKKSFLNLTRLKKHINTHYGVKPFECAECHRCFRLKEQLKGHMITHTDEMPYGCQYCDKRFRFKNVLKNHEATHTGARPYSCEVCSMAFTCWSNCDKHMKRKHGTTMAKNKLTPKGKVPITKNCRLKTIRDIDSDIKEWTEKVMEPRKRGKKVENDEK